MSATMPLQTVRAPRDPVPVLSFGLVAAVQLAGFAYFTGGLDAKVGEVLDRLDRYDGRLVRLETLSMENDE